MDNDNDCCDTRDKERGKRDKERKRQNKERDGMNKERNNLDKESEMGSQERDWCENESKKQKQKAWNFERNKFNILT